MLDRGQIEDWFHSTYIVIFATIAACSFLFFIPWELTHDDPIVDIRLLCQRQFGMAFLVMLAVGAILFGSNQITPQLMQTNFPYTAMLSGLGDDAGRPRHADHDADRRPGHPAHAAEILDGDRLRHHRAGDVVLDLADAGCELRLFRDRCASSRRSACRSCSFRSISSPMPGCRRRRPAKASALINVARNLGGSIGVSLANTELAAALAIPSGAADGEYLIHRRRQYQSTLHQSDRNTSRNSARRPTRKAARSATSAR